MYNVFVGINISGKLIESKNPDGKPERNVAVKETHFEAELYHISGAKKKRYCLFKQCGMSFVKPSILWNHVIFCQTYLDFSRLKFTKDAYISSKPAVTEELNTTYPPQEETVPTKSVEKKN